MMKVHFSTEAHWSYNHPVDGGITGLPLAHYAWGDGKHAHAYHIRNNAGGVFTPPAVEGTRRRISWETGRGMLTCETWEVDPAWIEENMQRLEQILQDEQDEKTAFQQRVAAFFATRAR